MSLSPQKSPNAIAFVRRLSLKNSFTDDEKKILKKRIFFIVAFLLLVAVWDTLIVMYSELTWQGGIVTAILMTCGTIAIFDNIRQKFRS